MTRAELESEVLRLLPATRIAWAEQGIITPGPRGYVVTPIDDLSDVELVNVLPPHHRRALFDRLNEG
jgi:hypothetical protein